MKVTQANVPKLASESLVMRFWEMDSYPGRGTKGAMTQSWENLRHPRLREVDTYSQTVT